MIYFLYKNLFIITFKMKYIEVSVDTDIKNILQILGFNGINIDSFYIDNVSQEYRFVILESDYPKIIPLMKGLTYCIADVELISYNSSGEDGTPGTFGQILSTRTFSSAYLAENNKIVIRKSEFCSL